MSGQSWKDCDPKTKKFVELVVQTLQNKLGENLISIWLHGSLAMGCYYPPKSDIDVLAIVKEPIDKDDTKTLLKSLAEIDLKRPYIGHLELSILLSHAIQSPKYPMLYELHYGDNIQEDILAGKFNYVKYKGSDPDLIAHLMVTKTRGACLFGKPSSKMIGDIKWNDYIAAVMDDINWILTDENIVESPFYGVLNACRALEMAQKGERTVSSKEEAGLWALEYLPNEHKPIVQEALNAYRCTDNINEKHRRTADKQWNKDTLLAFRDFVKTMITAEKVMKRDHEVLKKLSES